MTQGPVASPHDNHSTQARVEAVRRVQQSLSGTNLDVAAARGGLTVGPDGSVGVVLLGREFRVTPVSCDVRAADGGPVSPVDALLILRYLEADREVTPMGDAITFRDLPGGMFYAPTLAKRTTDLLVKAFGDDPARLRAALGQFPHETLDIGDVAARIHAIGRIHITFVLRAADEELPASADVFYDRIIGVVYSTDEVAALTTKLCVGLVRRP